MNAAADHSDNLDENSILAMRDALLRDSAPEDVGHWRNEQVWIGGGSISPHTAMFVPPHRPVRHSSVRWHVRRFMLCFRWPLSAFDPGIRSSIG